LGVGRPRMVTTGRPARRLNAAMERPARRHGRYGLNTWKFTVHGSQLETARPIVTEN
jgi:hypothetical protein